MSERNAFVLMSVRMVGPRGFPNVICDEVILLHVNASYVDALAKEELVASLVPFGLLGLHIII